MYVCTYDVTNREIYESRLWQTANVTMIQIGNFSNLELTG